MATAIQERCKAVQDQIFRDDYYVDLYTTVLGKRGLDKEGVEAMNEDDKELIQLFHYFWEELPDNPAIRRAPFFAICDIAENVFNGEDGP